MGDISVKVEGLGKRYRIGEVQQARYQTLRDQLASAFKAPFQRLVSREERSHLLSYGKASTESDHIWALKDISFEIKRGEVVGVIGRNGAGKTTLLKILSRITEPTYGTADIYGRVGSLLEVGTGFHKELTGRENVYLNGAILGMKKSQIERKFNQIVSFAEVEQFIDTPVKFYSSGMAVRLAFAVAAHLEPEIMLVDEVLAVGDAAFQKKCLSKMESVGEEGRTILFVSHHMPSITRLCPRTILIDQGRIQMDGPTQRVVAEYLSAGLGLTAVRRWEDPSLAPGNEIVRLCGVRVRKENGSSADVINIQEPVGIELEFEVLDPGHVLYPHFTLHNEEGVLVFASIDTHPAWRGKPRPAGRYVSTGWIPGNFLSEGLMIIGPAMKTEYPHQLHFYERDAVAFQVVESSDGATSRVDSSGHFPGVVRPYLAWNTQFNGNV